MKALILIVAVLAMFFAGNIQAQVSVNVSVGIPPMWGPVGYPDVRYYYLPDVESYYDIQAAKFIWYADGNWVHRNSLPSRYRSYDLYDGYKVVITDYRGNAPYVYFHDHKMKYAKGYRGPAQKNFGEKPGKGNKDYKTGGESKGSGKNKSHGGGNGKKK